MATKSLTSSRDSFRLEHISNPLTDANTCLRFFIHFAAGFLDVNRGHWKCCKLLESGIFRSPNVCLYIFFIFLISLCVSIFYLTVYKCFSALVGSSARCILGMEIKELQVEPTPWAGSTLLWQYLSILLPALHQQFSAFVCCYMLAA